MKKASKTIRQMQVTKITDGRYTMKASDLRWHGYPNRIRFELEDGTLIGMTYWGTVDGADYRNKKHAVSLLVTGSY